MAKKILVVLTSHDKLGNTGKPTGWFLPEFAHPYEVFAEAGYDVTVASPKGGAAPLDPGSVEMFQSDAASTRFLTEHQALWADTVPLPTLAGDAAALQATVAAHDALFYPGGHGPMFDLAGDADSQALAAAFAADPRKVVAAVCHGPAALASVKKADGTYLVAGRQVSGFTDAEEAVSGTTEVMPFLLESRLREHGAVFAGAPPFAPKVVVDGNLVTGQNPASSYGVGRAVVAALQ